MASPVIEISFDLDDTLICHGTQNEPLNFIQNLFCPERLRLGTRELFKKLDKKGYRLSIYTTSFRSKRYIRRIFRLHGISVYKIINGDTHAKPLKARGGTFAKIPDEFGFDIHIDDAPICPNDSKTSTKVFLVTATDSWAEKVLAEILSHKK